MTVRVLVALPLLLTTVGCVDEPRSLLVAPGGERLPKVTTALRPPWSGPRVPPHEATARRVLLVAQKVIDANPQAGLRPMFITAGVPHPEIFHSGGGARGYQVVISQGLVNQCKSDDELAAVLALELGRMVAEREAAAGPSLKQPEPTVPPEVPVGRDSGGTFGPPDGTRQMELAKLAARRSGPAAAPDPQALARAYLSKAGYDTAALTAVAPLLRKAEDHYEVEKSVKGVELGAPVTAKPKP